MNRRLILGLVVGGTFAVSNTARAETLVLPATSSTGVDSSPLQAGVLYEITVEGTYITAFAGQEFGAERVQRRINHPITPQGAIGETLGKNGFRPPAAIDHRDNHLSWVIHRVAVGAHKFL